jgi:hypothetical protein
MNAIVETAELTREEAAYAHLASFAKGDIVDVDGRNWFQPGTVIRAQRDGRTLEDAFLLVSGCGIVTSVRVRDLLSSKFTITSQADAKAGNVRHFDPEG